MMRRRGRMVISVGRILGTRGRSVTGGLRGGGGSRRWVSGRISRVRLRRGGSRFRQRGGRDLRRWRFGGGRRSGGGGGFLGAAAFAPHWNGFVFLFLTQNHVVQLFPLNSCITREGHPKNEEIREATDAMAYE